MGRTGHGKKEGGEVQNSGMRNLLGESPRLSHILYSPRSSPNNWPWMWGGHQIRSGRPKPAGSVRGRARREKKDRETQFQGPPLHPPHGLREAETGQLIGNRTEGQEEPAP